MKHSTLDSKLALEHAKIILPTELINFFAAGTFTLSQYSNSKTELVSLLKILTPAF